MKLFTLRCLRAAVCAAALTGASLSFAQLTLTNTPPWHVSDFVIPFGEPNTATYGQTFTAVAGNTFMNSFRFHLQSWSGAAVHFSAYVFAWDDATLRLTGPLLYMSAMHTLPAGTGSFQAFTFNTGSLSLTGGARYVAFLSASNYFDDVEGMASFGFTSADTYSGGNFVFMGNGLNFGNLSVLSWDSWTGKDSAFTMEFSPDGGHVVPEPSTYGLIGAMALLGLVVVRRIRRS